MPGPPIRKPSDHSPPAGSPRNIAGHHVLHRPLMPRHPPNAQKNKQQRHTNKTNNLSQKSYSKMLASTIQFTTNPPTPTPTPPTNREAEKAGQATRAHCPRTPTACHPQHARTPTTTKPGSSGRVSYASTRQPTPPQHPPHRQDTRAPASHPAFRGQQPPGRPGPNYTAQTRSNDQEATPTQPILRKEVIQPHLPVRLPCYDFVPITSPTFDRSP